MLIIIFSLKLGLFPTGGKGGLDSLVLPAVTVGFGLAALITRTTRSSMLDVLRQDYMTTARAKGCSEKQVITVHGLKNALIPIITAIGLQMSLVITGSVLAETDVWYMTPSPSVIPRWLQERSLCAPSLCVSLTWW